MRIAKKFKLSPSELTDETFDNTTKTICELFKQRTGHDFSPINEDGSNFGIERLRQIKDCTSNRLEATLSSSLDKKSIMVTAWFEGNDLSATENASNSFLDQLSTSSPNVDVISDNSL